MPVVHQSTMRTRGSAALLVMLLLLTGLGPFATSASARSVHSTSEVDLFPQGNFAQPSAWTTTAQTSFTEAPATYTESMVADQRMTMVHRRDVHLDTITVWAGSSPTNSNYSVGAPDGASTWSTGPEIELTAFDVSGLTDYELVGIKMAAAIQIPNTLTEDTVRISVQHTDGFDLLKTFAHTQGNVDYINNSAFEVDLLDLMNWTWSDISNMVFTLDYVSAGGVDDSRLVVDALGLVITVRTPWYGGEVASASAVFQGHPVPMMAFNLSEGTTTNLAVTDCGLTPAVNGTTGHWESPAFTAPPEQTAGRVHVTMASGNLEDVVVEYATAGETGSFSAFTAMMPNTLLPDAERYMLKLSVTDACVGGVAMDVNDPTLSLTGRVFGNNDGLNASLSRWLVFVNDELVSNQPMSLGSFTHAWPIGEHLEPGATSVEVLVKAWFTWDSDGSASESALEITSIGVSGGFDIEWDEDPVCQNPGDQRLVEDGGGLILPLLRRCTDDRTAPEDLNVTFTNTNPSLLTVDLTQGDVRLAIAQEASGQAIVGMTVVDAAGNRWTDAFTVIVDAVDDPPAVTEFPGIVPVERDVNTTLNLTVEDLDSTSLTASTNRTWATVDLAAGTVSVTPPVVGFQSVLVSVCDQTTCSERTLDLEVLALADLRIESMDFGDSEMRHGEIISMRVLVRNDGHADATGVSVRCETEDQLLGVETIPVLRPGELGSVTCDWQIPPDAGVVRFIATVDRGLEIPEGDETNNMAEELVSIDRALVTDGAESSSGITQSTVLVLSIAVMTGLLALIGYLMPPKIKKIQ